MNPDHAFYCLMVLMLGSIAALLWYICSSFMK
ncbi:MAG: hypothetical protein JW388_0983 [Nitrospira sp.]|nr:hypothetical protein [Nitrospira sp.]